MPGFRKPEPLQAYLKLAIFSPPGKGKTFTALLAAEGLAALTGKRIAVIDTEHGTDFYARTLTDRPSHPEAFDFDALYTRSITDAIAAARDLDPNDYCAIVIDSISHLWDACITAWKTQHACDGPVPNRSWHEVKRPFKDLMHTLMNLPMHVIITGRQADEFSRDEDTGELTRIGVRMRADAETAYEPHVVVRLAESPRAEVTAIIEKDRTGVLAGRTIIKPDFGSLVMPLLQTLGAEQAMLEPEDSFAQHDADAMKRTERERAERSTHLLTRFRARFDLAASPDEVESINAELTPAVKKLMRPCDVSALRDRYCEAHDRVAMAASPV